MHASLFFFGFVFFKPSLCSFQMARLNRFSAKVFNTSSDWSVALQTETGKQESLPLTKTHRVLHHLSGQAGCSCGFGQIWTASAGFCPSCCVSELLNRDIKPSNVFSALQLKEVDWVDLTVRLQLCSGLFIFIYLWMWQVWWHIFCLYYLNIQNLFIYTLYSCIQNHIIWMHNISVAILILAYTC